MCSLLTYKQNFAYIYSLSYFKILRFWRPFIILRGPRDFILFLFLFLFFLRFVRRQNIIFQIFKNQII